MTKKIYNFKNDSIPLSFRVEIETHKKYKKLESMKKKEINYKFNKWLKLQLNKY